MKSIINLIRNKISGFSEKLLNDGFRYKFQLTMVYLLLAVVAGVMSILNIFTQNYLLMWVTLIFAVTCFINLYYITRAKSSILISSIFFFTIVTAMLIYFIVSGNPEGFSVLWLCIIPSCGMMLLGRKKATYFCILTLAILIFFLWTPLGVSLLKYEYTESFKLRFPFLMIAIYFISLFLESIRVITHREMIKAKSDYEYLYIHDALTGVYNRYGFNKIIDEFIDKPRTSRKMFFMIIDIDDFKNINDTYGHLSGDHVLIAVANSIQQVLDKSTKLCRWGGEEFAIIVMGGISLEEAQKSAEKVRKTIANLKVDSEGNTLNVTASIGAVLKSNNKEAEISTLVRTADLCLYKAKDEGKNRVVMKQL